MIAPNSRIANPTVGTTTPSNEPIPSTSPSRMPPRGTPDRVERTAANQTSALNVLTAELIGTGVWSADSNGNVVHSSMSQCEQTVARTSIPIIVAAAHRAGVTDPNQMAYVLATAEHESKDGARMHELSNGDTYSVAGHDSYFDKYEPGQPLAKTVGNSQSGDGATFKGRGFTQLTGRANYASMSTLLGRGPRDLVEHPEQVEHDPTLAADVLARGLTKAGGFTGAGNLARLIPAGQPPGKADFYHARAAVNGIVESQATIVSNEARALAPIFARYRTALFGETH